MDRPKWKRRARRFLYMVIATIAAVLLIKWGCDATYFRGYDADLPIEQTNFVSEPLDGYVRETFVINSFRKQSVPVRLARPLDADAPSPAVLFLHGIGQNQTFLDEIAQPFVDAGFIFVTFDQYDRGLRKPARKPGGVRAAIHLRRRLALTVLETRRMVDYLQSRPDVAPERIYLIGASFGAIAGSTAAAMDPRIKAVILTYGGGNLRLLLSSDAIRGELGPATGIFSGVAAWYLAPGDPIRYIDGLSGRPVLFQNGRHDGLISVASAEAFHAAAGEPKEMVWYNTDHIGLDEAHVERVIAESVAWFLEQDKQAHEPQPIK